MEGDKEAYVEETGKALKRQRKNINELNVEKAELTRKLRVTKSRHNRNKDAENAAKIARLAEEQDTLGIMIKREKQNMKDLQSEINRIERQIAQQRRVANAGNSESPTNAGGGPGAGGPSAASMREKKDVGKRIVLLENRLDGVMVG